MTSEEQSALEQLEQRMRSAAPVPPPALRGRTLARCAAAESKRRRSGGAFFKWAFAAVFLVHWAASAALDSQQDALMAGPGRAPQRALVATAPVSSSELRSTLMARSCLLSFLPTCRDDWTPGSAAG